MGTPIEALPDLANLPPVRRGSRGQTDLLLPAGTSRQDRGRVAGRGQGTDGGRVLPERRHARRRTDRPVAPAAEGGSAMSEEQAVFVRGNDHLSRLLKDPETAADVASAVEEIREMDRAHAMSLAMIRKAGQLTQVEVAQRLGIGQGVVSRLENREHMLLSTLFGYLAAAGADTAPVSYTH